MKNSNINLFEGFIKPNKFNDTVKGLTIYSEAKMPNENFKNIFTCLARLFELSAGVEKI